MSVASVDSGVFDFRITKMAYYENLPIYRKAVELTVLMENTVRGCYENVLPFKGRIKVGMGLVYSAANPSSPRPSP